jgi:probable O-glycosylation ligase (exosortase A-associated)
VVRSLYLLLVYVAIFGMGLGAPFVFTLGYEWADIFRPEDVAWQILRNFRVSFLLGSTAVASYLLFDRRFAPKPTAIMVLTVLFGVWVTATTTWAQVPDAAWAKWDWAFKSIMFSAFIPFVIRSRNHIEAFLQVYVFSLAAHIGSFGTKTLLTGGGYALHLGLIERNFFLGEQDTLAAAALMAIPVVAFLVRHSRIIPRNGIAAFGYGLIVLLAVATIVGTQERAAPLGLLVVALALWWQSRKKILFAVLAGAFASLILASAPASWWERMSTISTSTDPGISVRFQVWEWTIDFAREHPFGGGFDAYRVNEVQVPRPNAADGDTRTEMARAYHSIYFEVLGEQGWVGLGLFLGLIYASARALLGAVRLSRDRADLAWCGDLARALLVSLLATLTVGAFVGFAFQPLLYYMFALSQSLAEYVRRATISSKQPAPDNVESLALGRP